VAARGRGAFGEDAVTREDLTVGLVDDHALFRVALRALLEPAVAVVWEAGDGRTALQLVDAKPPVVVLLDLGLPRMSGLAALREIRRRAPSTRVLILSAHDDPILVHQALVAGAAGFALKDCGADELLAAVRAVGGGATFLAPRLGIADAVELARRLEAEDTPAHARLSDRESEVFELLLRGLSNAQIAAELCISEKTVDTHRTRVLHKLGAHSMVELTRYAARHRLLWD
jgi:DNA-binding NarL/FixJ family response regulator